jgi:hypothetical protein
MPPNALVLAAALLACGTPRPTEARPETPARWGPYALDLVDEGGNVLPTFEHRGRTYVLGAKGRRYAVRVRNQSGGRVEVVVSVDGRDAVDGRPSALGRRGYVVDPFGEATVDGFRLSDRSVAAFRFGSVADSYAARMGDARDVGVIGVAVFGERPPRPVPMPPSPHPSGSLREDAGPEARLESAPAPGEAQASAERHAAPVPGDARAKARPGLGTEFGEERDSPVARVSFERAGARPDAVLTLRYDDRAGLLALGIDVDRHGWARRDDAWRREHADPFRRDAGYAQPPPGWRR